MHCNYDADITGGSFTKLSITINALKGILIQKRSIHMCCLGRFLQSRTHLDETTGENLKVYQLSSITEKQLA